MRSMLVELMVENLAVVERIRVRFHAGFNVLSGETGSGKSIVVDALGLLFGGRASADMVRTGCDRARVSGIFELPASRSLRAQLESMGLPVEEDELLVEREILSNGKSRAFAGSRPVTASLLRDMAPYLGDIHGQHDQQQLFDSADQLALVDAFARNDDQLNPVKLRFAAWKAAVDALEQLDKTEQERLRLADLWSYQVKEIESVSPKPGEDGTLEQEKKMLANVEKLEGSANAAYQALYDAPESAATLMKQAYKKIDELNRIDDSVAGLIENMKSAMALVDDTAYTLRDYLGKLEADPKRLDAVESRLVAIEKLQRKYGPTLDDVMAFHASTKKQLDAAENIEAHRSELKAAVDRAAAEYREAAAKLSQSRQHAAQKLEKKVEGELSSLAMERTRFRVAFRESGWSEAGFDGVEFLIAANVGEEPRPLNKIASGGELSRVALALKASTVGAPASKQLRTLVFDEVDAGIGGRAAESVGRRLKSIANGNQVLCVTHLAQIAGFADHHYCVEKGEVKGRTIAEIQELKGDARTREISRMLSGHLTPEAMKHAEQLIKMGQGAS